VRPTTNHPRLLPEPGHRHYALWMQQIANIVSFASRPMKKKGGTLAGIPRASGERNSPTGNGAFSNNQVSSFASASPRRSIGHALSSPVLLRWFWDEFISVYQIIHFTQPVVASESAKAQTAISAFRPCRAAPQNTPTSSSNPATKSKFKC
jgi:hypothetical protein